MNTFFVTGIPRSRTAWMAAYLTYGRTFCFHDGFVGLSHPKQLAQKFDSVFGAKIDTVGNSDPANLYFIDTLIKEFPQSHWILIKRDKNECIASAREAFGECSDMSYEISQMEKLERYADEGKICLQIVPFEKISEMAISGMFWNVLKEENVRRAKLFSTMNIQLTSERLSRRDLANPELFNHIDKTNECILA